MKEYDTEYTDHTINSDWPAPQYIYDEISVNAKRRDHTRYMQGINHILREFYSRNPIHLIGQTIIEKHYYPLDDDGIRFEVTEHEHVVAEFVPDFRGVFDFGKVSSDYYMNAPFIMLSAQHAAYPTEPVYDRYLNWEVGGE